MTTTRGTIIKVPDNSPGLLVVDGTQRPFTLAGLWRSAVAPALNQVVDIETDSSGAITSITAVDPQQLAKERLNQLGGVAQEQGKQLADLARRGVGVLAARMGRVALGAVVVLWISWFFLPVITFSMLGVSRSLTSWDLLGADVGRQGFGQESHGLFAFLGLVAIVAPLVAPFVKMSRANLLYAAPLAFVVLTALKLRWQIGSAARQANKAMGQMDAQMADLVGEMTRTAVKSLMSAISVGFGAYLLVAASLVLAAQVFRKRR